MSHQLATFFLIQLSVWQRVLQEEVDTSQAQAIRTTKRKDKSKSQSNSGAGWETGLVLALNKQGKVVRRGIGQPPWKQLVEQVNKT